MATASDVERALGTLIKNIGKASASPRDVPDRTLVCRCPDLQVSFHAHFREGRLQNLRRVDDGEAADVRISARSDDLIALIEGRLNVGFAFLMGKIRVEASAQDLMLIKGLF